MTDHKALIAKAKGRYPTKDEVEQYPEEAVALIHALADALEAATRELAFERLRKVDEQIEDAGWRAVVEAQALEQAAERMRAEHGHIWGVEWIVKTLTAWAVEIREGRQ